MDSNKPFTELKNARKEALAPRIPLRAPLGLFLELTNRCNFACKFCPESMADYRERAGGMHKITFENFKKICDDILELGKLKVLRYYNVGEPLLHPEAIAMIRYGSELGIAERTELTTNGSALTPDRADELITSGLDYLRISIYETDAERHKLLTGSSVTPQRIAGNVKAFRERRDALGAEKPFIYVKMIDPFDPEKVTQLRALYRGIADEVAIEPPHAWTNDEGVDLLESGYGYQIARATKPVKEVCPSPFYLLATHADGEISTCCVDWERKNSVGNVFRESLAEIWNGERMAEFRRKHIERRRDELPACRNCDFRFTFPDDLDILTDPAVLEREPK